MEDLFNNWVIFWDGQWEDWFPTPLTAQEKQARAERAIQQQENALMSEGYLIRAQAQRTEKECTRFAKERKPRELRKAVEQKVVLEKRAERVQRSANKLADTKNTMVEMRVEQVHTSALLDTMEASNAAMVDPAQAKRTALYYRNATAVRETVDAVVKDALEAGKKEDSSEEVANEADEARIRELVALAEGEANQALLAQIPPIAHTPISPLVLQESRREMEAKNKEGSRKLALFLSAGDK
jgi:hypothetical protein